MIELINILSGCKLVSIFQCGEVASELMSKYLLAILGVSP